MIAYAVQIAIVAAGCRDIVPVIDMASFSTTVFILSVALPYHIR